LKLHGFACWKGSSAVSLLSTEALERKEHAFLAVHSPIRDFRVEGSQGSDIDEPTEDRVLDVLSSRNHRHIFCVVEGEPGSGKSHLIRWLNARWPKIETDLAILIQRADGSLEGTLRQLKARIPERFQYLFQGLGAIHDATDEGRKRLFKSALALTMRGDHFTVKLPDSEWCDKWHLEKILLTQAVQEKWSAPERILSILSGRGLKGEDRSSMLASFTLYDVMELAKLHGEMKALPQHATMLVRKLHNEANIIAPHYQEHRDPDLLYSEIGELVPESLKFLQALKFRLNPAVQNLLGISPQGLKEMFFGLRREMKKENSRLILLLEDVTNFQGVDHQLIDVLVTQSSTRQEDDLCDLVSVMGITPAYYKQHLSQGNYIARITHFIRMGHHERSESFQDSSITRDQDSQVAFAARYLRAIRQTEEELQQWNESGVRTPPNRCDSCQHRTECHSVFGWAEVDRQKVGLYPFTAQSITGIFEKLRDPDRFMTQQTPRGMIQGVLLPVLKHPEAVTGGCFPAPTIQTKLIPSEAFHLPGPVAGQIEAQVPDESEQSRLRRFLCLWGQPGNFDSAGETYAGISRQQFETFGLHWLGSGSAVAADAPGRPEVKYNTLSQDVSFAEAQDPYDPSAPSGFDTRQTPTGGTRSTRQPTPPPKGAPQHTSRAVRLPKTTTEVLEKRMQQLAAWQQGGWGELADENYWNRCLLFIIDDLDWMTLGVPPYLKEKLFTEGLVKIQGTFKGPSRKAYFLVPAVKWVANGLEAFEVLRGPDSQHRRNFGDSFRHSYSRMLEKLSILVTAHVRSLAGGLGNGEWSFAQDAAAILVLRNWLRGLCGPSAPPWTQLEMALLPEPEAKSWPKKRVDSWDGALSTTNHIHDKLRPILRDWLVLSPGESGERGLCDAGECLKAITKLRSTLDLPVGQVENLDMITQLAELQDSSRVINLLRQRLPIVPRNERKHIEEFAADINECLQGNTVAEYLRRLGNAFEKFEQVGVEAPHRYISDWRTAKQKMDQLVSDGSARMVEDFLDSPEFTLPEDCSQSKVLEWCINAPAGALSDIREHLKSIDAAVCGSSAWLESYVGSASGDMLPKTLEDVHISGRRLLNAVNALTSAIIVGNLK